MPILIPRLGAALLCCVAAALLMTTSAQAAKTVPAELRVVDANGRTLAEQVQHTTGARIKTSRKANCFGPGTAGSGARVKVPGATALGLLADGGAVSSALRPLRVTDAFDFGLGICGIGRAVAPRTGFWYLKRNHAATTTGGDQTEVRRGDEILWYLIEDFNDPPPAELALKAPRRAKRGKPFTVRVLAYADDGTKTPARGAEVSGAAAPTDAGGRTTVAASDRGVYRLRATRGSDIPSNREVVCARGAGRRCKDGSTIGGTRKRDKIRGTRGADKVKARGGRDTVRVQNGGRDRVNCGRGRDKLVIRRGQGVKHRNCERVVRKRAKKRR